MTPAARAISVAKKLMSQYPNDEDWSNRAERLVYMVQNKIPTFGNYARIVVACMRCNRDPFWVCN